MTTYYSINIYPDPPTVPIFSGYFQVNSSITPNIITNFYDYSQPTGLGTWASCLLPMDDPVYPSADNVYPITFEGVNFFSNFIMDYYDYTYNNFNLWINGLDQFKLSNESESSNDDNVTVISEEIPNPVQPCFLGVTRILKIDNDTQEEEYIPISKIKRGDYVKGVFSKNKIKVTHCGYSPASVTLIAKYNFPRCIPKDFFAPNMPLEDIYLSGGHRIIARVGESNETLKIPTSYIKTLDQYELKSEEEIRQITNEKEFRYYHIELEDVNEGVYAGGLQVETLEEGWWDKCNFTENY